LDRIGSDQTDKTRIPSDWIDKIKFLPEMVLQYLWIKEVEREERRFVIALFLLSSLSTTLIKRYNMHVHDLFFGGKLR